MQIKAVVDRMEGSKAVLLLGDEEKQVIWPCAFLPVEVREGDIFVLSMIFDAQATREAKAANEALMKELLEDNRNR